MCDTVVINKEQYNFRVLNHLCTRCGEPVVPGKKQCQHHLDESALKKKTNRERCRIKNLCTKCGQNPPRENKSHCEECFQKHKKYYPATMEKYYNRKDNSRCVKCKIEIKDGIYCDECQMYMRTKDKIGYSRYKANNLCVMCGEIKDIDGVLCSRCKVVNNARAKTRNKKQRQLIIDHYGNKCIGCGITDTDVLSIDHINNDGNKHRKQIGREGTRFYTWIIKNNFPNILQILCMNCQWKKYRKTIK